MPGNNANPDTNQAPETINLPDESGIENPPSSSAQGPDEPNPQPDEVPPIEVPARPETPEHIPAKAGSLH